MINALKLIAVYVAGIALMWSAVYFFADAVKNYEVIEPEDGIHCVVVSRMMMTSVACWKLESSDE